MDIIASDKTRQVTISTVDQRVIETSCALVVAIVALMLAASILAVLGMALAL